MTVAPSLAQNPLDRELGGVCKNQMILEYEPSSQKKISAAVAASNTEKMCKEVDGLLSTFAIYSPTHKKCYVCDASDWEPLVANKPDLTVPWYSQYGTVKLTHLGGDRYDGTYGGPTKTLNGTLERQGFRWVFHGRWGRKPPSSYAGHFHFVFEPNNIEVKRENGKYIEDGKTTWIEGWSRTPYNGPGPSFGDAYCRTNSERILGSRKSGSGVGGCSSRPLNRLLRRRCHAFVHSRPLNGTGATGH